jgi:hypothetical protein
MKFQPMLLGLLAFLGGLVPQPVEAAEKGPVVISASEAAARLRSSHERYQKYEARYQEVWRRRDAVRGKIAELEHRDEWLAKIGALKKRTPEEMAHRRALEEEESELSLKVQRAKVLSDLAQYRLDVAQSKSIKAGGPILMEGFFIGR